MEILKKQLKIVCIKTTRLFDSFVEGRRKAKYAYDFTHGSKKEGGEEK